MDYFCTHQFAIDCTSAHKDSSNSSFITGSLGIKSLIDKKSMSSFFLLTYIWDGPLDGACGHIESISFRYKKKHLISSYAWPLRAVNESKKLTCQYAFD